MVILLKKRQELKDGPSLSKINGFRDVPQNNACVVDLTPFNENGESEDVPLWIKSPCYEGTVGYRFFEILGISDEEEIDTDSLNEEFKNSCVGIVIKNNEKNGKIYHNVIDCFKVDTEDGEEELEEYEEEDEDSEEEEEYEDEEDEEDEDEEDEDEDDDDEEDDEPPVKTTLPSGFRSCKRKKVNLR